MKIVFYKYHGAGNDFVIIDNRNNNYELSKELIAKICERRFGIGADGLMSLENDNQYDFRMKYYNSDGAEGSMCGNGGRCIVAFAHKLGIIKSKTEFIATDGTHKAVINSIDNNTLNISLEMNDVSNINENENSYFLDTGSPHHISFVDDIRKVNIFDEGRKIRYSDDYKKTQGTNVNFIEVKEEYLIIRTYERGVENETFACGTGATAAAIAYAHKTKKYNKEIKLKALGGELSLKFDYKDNIFKNVILRGPAQFVFNGEIEL